MQKDLLEKRQSNTGQSLLGLSMQSNSLSCRNLLPFLGSPLPSKHPGSPGSGKVHAQQGRVLPPGPTITHFLVFLLQTLQQAVMRCGKALKTDINTVILFLKAKHKVNCIYSSLSSNV